MGNNNRNQKPGKLRAGSKRQITRDDYSAPDFNNLKIKIDEQDQLQDLYNASVLYESRVFTTRYSETDRINDSRNENELWLSEERNRHKTLHWIRRPSNYMMSVAVFLYTFSSGVSFSAKLQLIMLTICKSIGDSVEPGHCNSSPVVQKKVSFLISCIVMLGNIISTLVSGKIGMLSDRNGRRKLLLGISAIVLVSKLLVLVLIHPQLATDFHPVLIIIASCLESFTGGMPSFMALGNTYLSDISEHLDRVVKMGILTGCMYTGMGLGPLVGSLLIKHYEANVILCYVELVALVLLVLFAVFIFPESRSPNAIQKSRAEHLISKTLNHVTSPGANHLSAPASVISTLYYVYRYVLEFFVPLKYLILPPDLVSDESVEFPSNKTFKKRTNFLVLITILIFFLMGSVYLGQVTVLYPTYKFKWTSVEVGYFITLIMSSRLIILFFVSPRVLKAVQLKYMTNSSSLDEVDLLIIRGSLFFEVAGNLVMTLAASSNVYLLSPLVSAFAVSLSPTVDATLIKYSPVDKVGQVMGALTMVKSLLAALIPSFLLTVYSNTISTNPKMLFYTMTALSLSSMVCTWFLSPIGVISEDTSTETDSGALPSPAVDSYGAAATLESI